MIRPDPTGWTVAIEHPDTGVVHTPAVTGTPSRQPTANALPTVDVPVENNAKWFHPDWENGAPMRVWVDGERQPLDWLESVGHSEGETTLSSEGGHELKIRTERDVDLRPTHELVRTLVDGRTPYDVTVTAPPANRENGVEIADWSSGTILSEHCPDVADPTAPVAVSDDGTALVPQQIAYPKDALLESATAVDARTAYDAAYSGGKAALLQQSGDHLRFTFQPEYTIPADNVGIKVRDRALGYSNVRYSWSGTTIDEQHNDATTLEWRAMGQGQAYTPGMGYSAAVGATLRAGEEYTFDIEVLEGGAEYAVDAVALWDTRHRVELEFPNPGDGNNGQILYGPALYPSSYRARFTPIEAVRSVVGGRVRVFGRESTTEEITDPEDTTTYLSNDGGNTYAHGPGNILSADFNRPGPSLAAIITLGRRGNDPSRATLPARGFNEQRIEGLRFEADLVDTPITVDRAFDAQLHEILTTLANESDSVWEYRRSGDGPGEVVWTQPGRSPVPSTHAPQASSFQLDKDVGTTVETAVVYGASRSVSGERITADHGSPQPLAHERLQRGSVSVVHADQGTRFAPGEDYSVDYERGQITTHASGRIEDGAAIAVSYGYQTQGEYTNGVAGPSEDIVQDIPAINSNYAAGQAARLIVEERQRDQLSGQLVIPARNTGFSVVEYLRPEDLPIGQGGRTGATAGLSALHIKAIDTGAAKTTLRLGNRRSVSEIVSDISNRVSATSRQT